MCENAWNERMLNVAITGPALDDPGGVANYYRTVLPLLKQGGRVVPHYLPIGSGGQMVAGVGHFFSDQRRVARTLRSCHFDLVHVNPSLNPRSFLRDGLFIRTAKQQGLPVVVFFRGWREHFARQIDSRWKWLFQNTYGRADAFIVLASAFSDWLQRWGIEKPIYRETTVVDDRLSCVPEAAIAANRSEELRVLFLSRIEAKKGIFETIDAVEALLRGGRQLTLTIAGSGTAEGAVRQAIEARPLLAKNVNWAGYVRGDEKIRVLRDNHVFCLPTYDGEGLPNAALEAMASGMALVCSTTGGLADLVKDGRMGKLVRIRDSKDLAHKLDWLIQHPEALSVFREYNAKYAREHFLASSVAARLERVYHTMLLDASPGGGTAGDRRLGIQSDIGAR